MQWLVGDIDIERRADDGPQHRERWAGNRRAISARQPRGAAGKPWSRSTSAVICAARTASSQRPSGARR